jgi:hypothetical protein
MDCMANTVKCGCGHSMVLYVALELGCNKTYFGGLAPIVRGIICGSSTVSNSNTVDPSWICP